MKELTVTIKNVYGTEVVYPADETALTFANLAGTKTLTISTINLIKRLGYTINVKQQFATL